MTPTPGAGLPAEPAGFSLVNLAIVLLVALVVVPLYLRVRTAISRNRRERWAREDAAYEAQVEQRDRQPGRRADEDG